MDTSCLFVSAVQEFFHHFSYLVSHQMRGNADNTVSSQGQYRKSIAIVTTVNQEIIFRFLDNLGD